VCIKVGVKLDLLGGDGKQYLFSDIFTRVEWFVFTGFFFGVKVGCKRLSMLSCWYMPAAAILIKPKRGALEFAC